MEFLIKLPNAISCRILCIWTAASDLIRLDSACCRHMLRKEFLRWFEQDEFIVESTGDPLIKRNTWLLKRNIKMKELDLTSDCVLDYAVPYLVQHGQFIRTIKVTNRMTKAVYQIIIDHCKNLERLCVDDIDPNMVDLVHNLPKLHTLIIFTNDGSLYPELKEIHMPEVISLSIWGIKRNLNIEAAVICGCPLLQRLHVSWCGREAIPLFKSIAHHLTHLRALQVHTIDDAALLLISDLCPNLIHFDISHSAKYTDAGVLAVVRRLKLQSLGLQFHSKITTATILNIAVHCAHTLQMLYVKHALPYSYAGEGPEPQWNALPLHEKCLHLRSFRWCASFIFANAPSNYCPLITDLHVVQAISDGVLFKIAQHCKSLRNLDLGVHVIGDSFVYTSVGLRAVAEGCPQLRTIRVHKEVDISQFMDVVCDFPGLLTKKYEPYKFDVMSVPIYHGI